MNKNKTTFFKIFPNANLVANELPFTVSLPKKKKNIYIYIYELGSSYTWCNFKQYYTTQYFLIQCEF